VDKGRLSSAIITQYRYRMALPWRHTYKRSLGQRVLMIKVTA